jgi:hypothetical protein
MLILPLLIPARPDKQAYCNSGLLERNIWPPRSALFLIQCLYPALNGPFGTRSSSIVA